MAFSPFSSSSRSRKLRGTTTLSPAAAIAPPHASLLPGHSTEKNE
jgi:hypothetical protein